MEKLGIWQQGIEGGVTLPKTNSEFSPKNAWLEYDPFLLGFGNFFRGELLVSGRIGAQTSWNILK